MHHIEAFRLQPHHIPELRNARTLFAVDFRACSSAVSENSWWVSYYENMLLPVIEKGWAVMNQEALPLYKEVPGVEYVVASHSSELLKPLAQRLQEFSQWDAIDEIWAGVAHPALDALAAEKGKLLSYSFPDYRKNNDKILQKLSIPSNLTPAWKRGVHQAAKGFLLKNSFGCGGLEVWHPDQTHNLDGVPFTQVVKENEGWYQEQFIQGVSCSASLYSNGSDTIIFGWSELLFSETSSLSCLGGKLHDVATLESYILKPLTICIDALKEGPLKNYQGFWGIDFIVENGTRDFYFLEANVRLTTLTVPQLLLGKLNATEGVFHEDLVEVQKYEIVTNYDAGTKKYDVLTVLS